MGMKLKGTEMRPNKAQRLHRSEVSGPGTKETLPPSMPEMTGHRMRFSLKMVVPGVVRELLVELITARTSIDALSAQVSNPAFLSMVQEEAIVGILLRSKAKPSSSAFKNRFWSGAML